MKINPVYEMPADEYNKKLAKALKKIEEFKQPEWAVFVKSGPAKKRPPQDEDFWYKRAASILRQIYIHKIVGVNRLKTRYGSKKNRGMRPERFKKASGKIIRTILQQAEAAGLLEKTTNKKRAGRQLTEKSKEFLESIKADKIRETKYIEKSITTQNKSDENKEQSNKKQRDTETSDKKLETPKTTNKTPEIQGVPKLNITNKEK